MAFSAIFRRRELVLVITALVTSIVLFDRWIAVSQIKTAATVLKSWSTVILAFAVWLGAMQLFRYEGAKIQKREKEWQLSVWTLVLFVVSLIIGFMPPVGQSTGFLWLLLSVITPLDATMQGLASLCYFIVIYRAFRARNFEVLILIASYVIIQLFNAPTASLNPTIQAVGQWVFNVASVGGSRGVIIVEALGITAMCVRVLIGRERGYFR